EVRTGDARGRALPGEVVLDPHLAFLRPESTGDPVELRVALDTRVMRREVPRLAREVLQGDVLQLRSGLDEELRGLVRVRAELGRRRVGLLDEREARTCFGDDEQAPE